MKKTLKVIMLLSILVTNNINAVKYGQTHQEQHSTLNQSDSECDSDATSDYESESDSEFASEAESDYEMIEPRNQPDTLAEEYNEEKTVHKNYFNKFENNAKWVGLSGLCLVAGIVILFNKLLSQNY